MREPVATALFSKGVELSQRGDWKPAVEAYNEVTTRFGDDPTPEIQEVVRLARQLKDKIEGDP